ncbi:MAG: hypothetical protein QNJ30_14035 [Kiloniellales bacterium]|nr:hypothetical protein [Kiloniellales bacterium]
MGQDLDVRPCVLEMLNDNVDRVLLPQGFRRPNRSKSYDREIGATTQGINILVEKRPRYYPGAVAHIRPWVSVSMKTVGRIAKDLVDDNLDLLGGSAEIVVNQPIELVAPKDRHEEWYAFSGEDFAEIGAGVAAFIGTWILPFLEDYREPADLIRGAARQDDRLIRQKHFWIFVMAAHIELGEAEAAKRLLAEHFSGLGLRRRFAPVYAYFGEKAFD